MKHFTNIIQNDERLLQFQKKSTLEINENLEGEYTKLPRKSELLVLELFLEKNIISRDTIKQFLSEKKYENFNFARFSSFYANHNGHGYGILEALDNNHIKSYKLLISIEDLKEFLDRSRIRIKEKELFFKVKLFEAKKPIDIKYPSSCSQCHYYIKNYDSEDHCLAECNKNDKSDDRVMFGNGKSSKWKCHFKYSETKKIRDQNAVRIKRYKNELKNL